MLVYAAMRVGQVALVAPLASTEGAIAALIAILAGESIAAGVGLALGAIAVGVCLCGVPDRSESAAITREHHGRAVSLAVLGACSFGASLYATGKVGGSLPEAWVVLSARVIGVFALALPLTCAAVCRSRARWRRCSWWRASARSWASTPTSPERATEIAVAAVLSSQFAGLAALGAYFLFGERLSRVQLAGVCTVVVGVAVLSALRA